jgi:hypothetical protein
MVGIATCAFMDDMLTTAPAIPSATIVRAARCVATKVPVRFTRITRSKVSRSCVRKSPPCAMPALFTSTETGPTSASIRSNSARIAAASPMSQI